MHHETAPSGPQPPQGPISAPAAVIVHYRKHALTARCLASLLQHCPGLSRIYVVDNSPGDGSLAELQAQFSDQRLVWLPQTHNLGFGEGCNAGMRAALAQGATAVLLLNNDAWVEDDTVAAFVAAEARYHGKALLTGCVAEPDGRLWYAGGDYDLSRVGTRHWTTPTERERQVPFVSGCLMWLPRALIEACGGFAPDYFLYLEDLDLCLRMQRLGFSLVCLPEILAVHAPSSSTGGRSQPLSVYYQNRNRWLLLRRHGRLRHWLAFVPLYALGLLKRCLSGQARSSLQALRDALRGRWGQGPAYITAPAKSQSPPVVFESQPASKSD